MYSLIHSALFPSTRFYHDADGNYRSSSTDVTACLVLLGHEHSANGLIDENGIIFSSGSLLDDNYKQSFTP